MSHQFANAVPWTLKRRKYIIFKVNSSIFIRLTISHSAVFVTGNAELNQQLPISPHNHAFLIRIDKSLLILKGPLQFLKLRLLQIKLNHLFVWSIFY